MKNSVLVLSLWALLLIVPQAHAADANISVARFQFVDHAVIELPAQPMANFEFLLVRLLNVKSSIPVAERADGDLVICGRVSRLNGQGDARIEIGFGSSEECANGIDAVADMVAFETKMDHSVDAVIGLVEETRHMITLFLRPQDLFISNVMLANK